MRNNTLIKIHLLCFILLLPLQIHAQYLVVGSSDPNEVLTISNTTVQYDTVLVMNQGLLIINNSDFTVNRALIVKDTGSLNVENSNFFVNGSSIFIENSSSTLKDNLTFRGDIFSLGGASLLIDSANVNIPMTFVGQHRFIGLDSAEFRIANSSINLGSGKLGGTFSGQSSFTQLNTSYQSQIGIAMTIGAGGQAAFVVDNCTGGMEFVITDSANVDISNSAGFILWHTLVENSIANLTFPPANSIIPNASDVSNYSFSGALAGVSGIHYSLNVQNTNGVFWAVLPRAGSNVTVNNSTVIGCGFTFKGTVKDTISGLINDSLYTAFTAPFSDRVFNLNNTIIKAWNFYTLEESELIIRNSVFGEALTFHESKLTVENSICDGTGGYFGARQNSTIHVKESTIKRLGTGPAIIVNKGNSKIVLDESTVIGAVVTNNTSTLIYSNMNFDHEPVVNDAAFFLEVSLDSSLTPDQESITPITGTLRAVNGSQNQDMITGLRLEYSNPDSPNKILIADLSYTQDVVNGVLFDWNTQGLPSGDYLLWLATFVNGDSLISTKRKITLSSLTTVEDLQGTPEQFTLRQNYPNPFNPSTTIAYRLPFSGHVLLRIYNVSGQEVKILVDENLSTGSYSVIWDGKNNVDESVAGGVYFYTLKMGESFIASSNMILLK